MRVWYPLPCLRYHFRAGKGTTTDEILDAGFVLEKEVPLLPSTYYFLVFEER